MGDECPARMHIGNAWEISVENYGKTMEISRMHISLIIMAEESRDVKMIWREGKIKNQSTESTNQRLIKVDSTIM